MRLFKGWKCPTDKDTHNPHFVLMALYTQATDLNTKQTIWVATNVVKGRPQLNSHSSECYKRDGIDGFPAAELAGLYTDYVGPLYS